MFTEETLLLTFQYIAYIFVLPPLVILIIDRVVGLLAKDAFSFYSVTGVVGAPIHELSHAGACILFGMRILQMKLYSPNRETGTLGFVSFAYNPRSTLHAIGLVVQGVAPLIMAYAIFMMIPWGDAPKSVLQVLQLTDHSPTYMHAIAGASALLIGNLTDGPRGFLWFLVALIIGLHAIPSWADIRIAAKGMFTLLALAIGFSALSQLDLSFLPPGIRDAIYTILGLVMKGFFWLLEEMTYAVTMVTVVAVVAIFLFLALPVMAIRIVHLVRGTPPGADFDAQRTHGSPHGVDQQAALAQALAMVVNGQQLGTSTQQTSATKSRIDYNIINSQRDGDKRI